ncbi:MAG: CDP-2,3-bis-(O-geranylgeranyl)-sn-glycerol synthase [Candidatus Thorarchaeota archaeon]|nr:CDP-2,3-bis-(O-geranylgeranyl)-sn-glycerol synthase [Candidatus Thorarchaeota archaeon]
MYELIATVELALWFGLPAWIANSTPVVFGGGRPIDGGKLFRDGRRILGDGKTIRGLFAGVFFGTLTGLVQSFLVPCILPVLDDYITVTGEILYVLDMNWAVALLLSVGAMLGDLVGSFLKRRIGLVSGGPSPVLDQLGFILIALIVVYPLKQVQPVYVLALLLLTLFTHWVSNALGYLLGLKKNPW